MLRLIVFLALAAGIVWFGASVKLGKRTLFGHVQRIWATEEVQDLKHGVEEKAAPAVDRVKRGVKAGFHAAADEGSGSAGSGSSSVLVPAP